jgi:hypothetical protein
VGEEVTTGVGSVNSAFVSRSQACMHCKIDKQGMSTERCEDCSDRSMYIKSPA